MSASLAVVTDNTARAAPAAPAAPAAEESLSARIRRLQAEARQMAREHVAVLEGALMEVARTAAEIADGGEAYPVGARELARQLIAETEARMLSLEMIMTRGGAH